MKKGEIYLANIKLSSELEASVRPVLVSKEDGTSIPLSTGKRYMANPINVNFKSPRLYLMNDYVVTLDSLNILYKLGELVE